ncbi:MAG TPA: hypothetical protein VMW41_02215 [Candidatus Bathyarchaeia archaeon]|nr:hypothetical protein [Candidatus Bathyarchaeia archaeon]
MKKSLIGASIIFLVAVTILGLIRFVIGGPEDDWLCVDGQWVKHGNPRHLVPRIGCGEAEPEELAKIPPADDEQLIGGDQDEHGCLIAAGYSWCEVKQKCLREWEEPCELEEVFNFFTALKDNVFINFSGIGIIEFKWNIKGEKVGKETKIKTLNLSGKAISASEVLEEKINEICDYFEKEGFAVSVYNIAAGTVTGTIGYQKDNLVCLISNVMSGFDFSDPQAIPTPSGNVDIEVSCGLLE